MSKIFSSDDLKVLERGVEDAKRKLAEAERKLTVVKNQPKPLTKLPRGFKFWFNSRRNDPLFPGYYVLELKDESGKKKSTRSISMKRGTQRQKHTKVLSRKQIS